MSTKSTVVVCFCRSVKNMCKLKPLLERWLVDVDRAIATGERGEGNDMFALYALDKTAWYNTQFMLAYNARRRDEVQSMLRVRHLCPWYLYINICSTLHDARNYRYWQQELSNLIMLEWRLQTRRCISVELYERSSNPQRTGIIADSL